VIFCDQSKVEAEVVIFANERLFGAKVMDQVDEVLIWFGIDDEGELRRAIVQADTRLWFRTQGFCVSRFMSKHLIPCRINEVA